MRKRFSIWGTLIIFVLAFIFHNLYAWTSWELFKPISAVNESVWEHMKMLFFAGFFYYLLKLIINGWSETQNIAGNTASLLTMIMIIPMTYYTYTSILGKGFVVIDLIITFIAALMGEYVSYRLSGSNHYRTSNFGTIVAGVVLMVMLILFVWFTYYPPSTPIFMCV